MFYLHVIYNHITETYRTYIDPPSQRFLCPEDTPSTLVYKEIYGINTSLD